jgi:pteridine reductase
MPAKRNSQTALITGSADRIGKALALGLAECGYAIALHYNRSKETAVKTAAEIRRRGSRCETFACDLSNEFETKELIPAVLKKLPGLSLLINNASLFDRAGLIPLNLKNFDDHIAINLKAPYILTSVFAQAVKKGHIINILDTHITRNQTAHLPYLLSKKSLYDLTKIAALELAPQIRVNAVAPGLILPPDDQSADYLDRLAKRVPLQRKGNPAQIVQSVKFLMENDYLTGQVIFNDGGEHLL